MDFASLAITPLAAIVSWTALILALAAKRYHEPHSLIVAMLLSLVVNALTFQPWHYVGWEPLLAQFGLLTLLGFCFGSIVVLVPAKTISAVRSRRR